MLLPKATNRLINKTLQFVVVITSAFNSTGLFAQGSVQSYSIPGSQIVEVEDSATHNKFRLFIKVPQGYESAAANGSKYPVIYVTDATYNFPVIEGFMRAAMYGKNIEASIIVGISQDMGSTFIDSRVYYYTPIHDAQWQRKTGGGDEHLRFIRDDVINYIESHFPADPEQRTYVGYSLGGLLGAYAFLTQPEMFANYLLVSPSLWYDDGYIFRLMASDKVVTPKTPVKVFISAGEFETTSYDGRPNDLLEDAKSFTKLVRGWNNEEIEIKFHLVAGADHSVAFPEPMVKALHWMHKGTK